MTSTGPPPGARPAAAAEAPLQYADFARWQRERLSGRGAASRPSRRGRERLPASPAAIDLPTDHPRPPISTYRGSRRQSRLSAGTSERIRAFARARGNDDPVRDPAGRLRRRCWPATAGQDDDHGRIGHRRAGTGPSSRTLIGLFANTVALRNDVSGDPSFRELLRRVGRIMLAPSRTSRRRSSGWWPSSGSSPTSAGTRSSRSSGRRRPRARCRSPGRRALPGEPGNARSDLTLWVEEGRTGYELEWEYSTDLFEADPRSRPSSATSSTCSRPRSRNPTAKSMSCRCSTRPNATSCSAPSRPAAARLSRRLHARAVRAAGGERRPDGPPFCSTAPHSHTRELNERANRSPTACASSAPARRRSWRCSSSVRSIWSSRSSAVLKAGGAYVPLDPDIPRRRGSRSCSATQPRRYCSTAEATGRSPPRPRRQRLCLDAERA